MQKQCIGRRYKDELGLYHEQYTIDHLINTGKYITSFLDDLNLIATEENVPQGQLLGYLHDIGKYSEGFKERIYGLTTETVDHASAGGQLAIKLMKYHERRTTLTPEHKLFFLACCYAVMGHHAGLTNFGSENDKQSCLYNRLNHLSLTNKLDYSKYKEEINMQDLSYLHKVTLQPLNEQLNFQAQFFIRFLFSCLVDADRLDAQAFTKALPTITPFNPNDLLNQFNTYMATLKSQIDWEHLPKQTQALNTIRDTITQNCIEASNLPKGFFTLTVPTGGGKTLSSMAFALHHSKTHTFKRIIQAIPFTSIIEQNAKVYKAIFGEENVLEHHCTFENPYKIQDEGYDHFQLIQSNWDVPIVMTTNVQCFETLFTHKASRARKMHNMANSIIILDEVQAIPIDFLKPCLATLSELVLNYGCSVVFCSATQPHFDLHNLLPKQLPCTEIINQPETWFQNLVRVKPQFINECDMPTLTEVLQDTPRILCIVNTKRHAKELYQATVTLDNQESVFHLSTNMCPLHRLETIAKIRKRLKDNLPCKVISTSLIEAGVDIDFPVVYRALTGLDSLVQAAGRCNREGRLPYGEFVVFIPKETIYQASGYLQTIARITETILHQNPTDFLALPLLDSYFKALFEYIQQTDASGILDLCQHVSEFQFPFKDISHQFRLIDSRHECVYIPYNQEAKKLIYQVMNQTKVNNALLNKLNKYSVAIPTEKLKRLVAAKQIRTDLNCLILTDMACYDANCGI